MHAKHRPHGEATREKIYAAALRLFHDRGFDGTTMRQIAQKSGMSLGAAYHYYPSKHAILLDYYRRAQDQHEKLVHEGLEHCTDLRSALGLVFHARLDTIQHDRDVMVGLMGVLVDPKDPTSLFAENTRDLRDRTKTLLRRALAVAPNELSDDQRELAAWALWALMMGVLLYFVHDRSENQTSTRQLIDDTLDLVPPLMAMVNTPFARPLFDQIKAILQRADILPV